MKNTRFMDSGKPISKTFMVLLLVVGAFFIFSEIKKTQAGAITVSSVSVSSSAAEATNVDYTVVFTPATAIPSDGSIHVQFRWRDSHTTTVPNTPTKETGTSATIDALSRIGNEEFEATVTGEIAGGTELTIKAGGMTNPTIGRFHLYVWTTQNDGTVIDSSSSSYDLNSYYTIGTPLVVGRVTDPNGEGMDNTWVNVHTVGSNPIFGGGNSDTMGYYSIGTLNDDTVPDSGTTLKISAFASGDDFELGQSNEDDITFNGSTVTKNIQFVAATKTIAGTVKLSDGTPVANATVNFWKMNGNGYTNVTTDSNGEYSVLTKGGQWDGMPQAQEADIWAYGMPPMSIVFNDDTTAESQTVNFTVLEANATISGKVRLPNGSVPSNTDNFWVGAHAMMMGANGILDSNGNFSFSVPSGTYMLEIMDSGQDYAAPEITPFFVGEEDSYNLGTITLISRSATITGVATDQDGDPVNSQHINAFMMKGMGWADATTNGSGRYTLKVFPGKWMVQAAFGGEDGGSNRYVLDGNPEEVKVGSGETKTVNISMVQASATIAGSIVDSDGEVLTDMYGWTYADKSGSDGFMGPGLGGPVNMGAFSFNVPPGTYDVGLGPMPGSGYSAGTATSVTVVADQTVAKNITAYANDMTISGKIRDENGDTVTGVFMEVFATNDTGGWQNAMINQSNGTYTINVSSVVDPWSIGYFIDPSTGYFSEKLTSNSVSGNSGSEFTKNITVRSANATITGSVLDGDRSPMEDVFVFADNRSGSQERETMGFMGPMFMNDNVTDSNGNFSINVPSGTYYVGASIPRDARPDLINPERVEVTVEANGSATASLAFKSANVPITGTITLDGTPQGDAYVWAWSEEGGYNEADADSSGNYTLNVTEDDTWHLGVNNDVVDTTDYVKSAEVIIETGSQTSIEQDLTMETVPEGLVSPVSTTFSATSSKVSNMTDGSRITVPANSMGSSGNVTMNISSTSELPRTTNLKPISTGLELTAMTSTGTAITSFNSDVNITIPYDEDDLADLLLTEDDLAAAYWDETNGVWQPLDNYSIDKDNNQIVLSTSHFTTFAIVGDGVTGGTTTNTGKKGVIDSWKAERFFTMTEKAREKIELVIKGRRFNSGADVTIGGKSADSVKKYVGGRKIVAKFTMKDLLRAKNTKRRIIRIINPNADTERADEKIDLNKIPFQIPSKVINTTTKEGISNIQKILFNEGFGNDDISGSYDENTKNAVIEFQKTYNINPPVGVVGPLTTAKLLEFKN